MQSSWMGDNVSSTEEDFEAFCEIKGVSKEVAAQLCIANSLKQIARTLVDFDHQIHRGIVEALKEEHVRLQFDDDQFEDFKMGVMTK